MKRWMMFGWIGLLAMQALAQERPGSGSLMLEDETGTVLPALLRDVDVELNVQGLLAHVRLRQRFVNASKSWMEGLYLLPMPEQARIDTVVLEYADVRLKGEVRLRQQAKAEYRKARAEGRRAALLSWKSPGFFDVRVANIPPAEVVTVEVAWVQAVEWVQGGFELRLPLTYTPRYHRVESREQVGTESATHLSADMAENALAMPQFSLQGHLRAGMPLARVFSRYHRLHVEARDDDEFRLTLDNGLAAANRDLVLRWEPERSDEPVAGLYHQQSGTEHYWALLLVPQQPKALPEVARELVFVVDVSGSMEGASLHQAKAALLQALQSLKPGDAFNVIAFNHESLPLWSQSRPVGEDTVEQAMTFIHLLEANGGTEMLPALEHALQQPAREGLLRQVVFLTDGAVAQPVELYRLVKQRGDDVRLFPVGIGSAPNAGFMRQMARLGRGAAWMIGDLDEVEPRMTALFRQLRSPALQDVRVDWPGPDGERKLPDLYLEQPLWQVVRTDGPLPPWLGVEGRLGDAGWQRKLSTTEAVQSPWLFKLWAGEEIERQRMRMAMESPPPEVRQDWEKKLAGLALEAELVSPWTSFVVTAQKRIRPANVVTGAERVANAGPARGRSLMLPQTELGLSAQVWLILVGLCLVLLGRARRGLA